MTLSRHSSALAGQLLQLEKCRKPALGTANPEWGYGRAQGAPNPMDTALCGLPGAQSWAPTAGLPAEEAAVGAALGPGVKGTKHTEMAVSLHGNFINTRSNLSWYTSQWLQG